MVSKTDESESARSVNRKNAGTDLDEKDCVDAAVVFGPVVVLGSLFEYDCAAARTYTLVIWAHLPQTTLPLVVTRPSSETLTSTMVPLVRTPSWVYRGFWGFFLTERMGSWTVTPSSGLENRC